MITIECKNGTQPEVSALPNADFKKYEFEKDFTVKMELSDLIKIAEELGLEDEIRKHFFNVYDIKKQLDTLCSELGIVHEELEQIISEID